MASVTNEAIKAFQERFSNCMVRIGAGKVGIDSNAVRKLVRENREVAARFIELDCILAQSNPALFQGAMMLAVAYQVEFNDPTLAGTVQEKARAAGAEDWLNRMGIHKQMPIPYQERKERKAAEQWWKSTSQPSGRCDNCNSPLRRGEGYLVTGRVFMIGSQRFEPGEELLCEGCFRTLDEELGH